MNPQPNLIGAVPKLMDKMVEQQLERFDIPTKIFETAFSLGIVGSPHGINFLNKNQNPLGHFYLAMIGNDFDSFGAIYIMAATNHQAVMFFDNIYSNQDKELSKNKLFSQKGFLDRGALTYGDAEEKLIALHNNVSALLTDNNISLTRVYDYIALTYGLLLRHKNIFDAKTMMYRVPNPSSAETLEWLKTENSLQTIFRSIVVGYSPEESSLVENTPKEWLEAFIPEDTINGVSLIKESLKQNLRSAVTEVRRSLLTDPKSKWNDTSSLQKKINNSRKNIIFGHTNLVLTIGTDSSFSLTARNPEISSKYEYSYNSNTQKYYEIS